MDCPLGRVKLAPFDEVVERILFGYKACCFDPSCKRAALSAIFEIDLLLNLGQFDPLASTGESLMGEAFADSGASYAKEVFQMPRITPALVKKKKKKKSHSKKSSSRWNVAKRSCSSSKA